MSQRLAVFSEKFERKLAAYMHPFRLASHNSNERSATCVKTVRPRWLGGISAV